MEEYQFNEEYQISGEPSPEVKMAVEALWKAVSRSVEAYRDLSTDKLKIVEDANSLLGVQEALREKYNELETEYSALVASYDELKQDLAKLKDSSAILPEKEEQIRYYEQKLKEAEENSAYLTGMVSTLQLEKENFQFAQKDIANKNHELHKRSETIEKLQNTIAELESRVLELNNFRKELGISEDGRFNQDTVISQLKENLDKAYLDLQVERSLSKEQEQRFHDELGKYKQIWKAQEGSLEDYAKQLNEKNRIISELEQKVELLTKDKQDITAANIALNNEKKRLAIEAEKLGVVENEIALKDTRIEELGAYIAERDVMIGGLNEKIKNLEAEVEQKAGVDSDQLRKMKQDIDNKDILISNLTNRIKYLNESIQAYETSIRELTGKLSGYEAQDSKYDERINEVNAQLEEAREIIARKDSILDELSTNLMGAESRIIQVESALEERENHLLDIKKENDELYELNDKLDNELKEAIAGTNAANASHNSELEDIIKDKDALISEYEKELDYLNELKFSNYNTIQQLQEELTEHKTKYCEIQGLYDAAFRDSAELQEDRKETDEIIGKLEEAVNSLTNELELKQAELDKAAMYFADYDKTQEDLRNKNKLVNDYSSHIKYLTNQNIQQGNTIKEGKVKIAEMEIALKEKDNLVESAKTDFARELTDLAGSKYLDDYSDVIRNLIMELLDKNSVLERLSSEDNKYGLLLRQKDELINSLSDKVRSCEVQLMRKDEIITENYNQIKDLNNTRISNKGIIIELQENISRLERELEFKEEEVKANLHNLNIIQNLKLQVEAKNQILDDHNNQIKGLSDLNTRYYNDIKDLNEKIVKKEKDLKDKSDLVEILKEEIQDREDQETGFDNEIEKYKAMIADYEATIADMAAAIENNSAILKNTGNDEEALSKIQIENLALRQAADHYKSALTNSKEQLVALEGTKYLIEKELANLKNECSDQGSVLERLQQNLRSKDELTDALEMKIMQLEQARSASDLKRIILVDKIEKYMEKLEKVISIGTE